ncbi:hypothetical protein K3495_g383 [Podosphaera aphanis]|nr:hypothetical protein K3495_g383 [Podosphaera aphanis]
MRKLSLPLNLTWPTIVLELFKLSFFLPCIAAADHISTPETIRGTNAAGLTTTLFVDRDPALYTGDFGDCMGGQSLINLTSFDAAYYADNMTVLFNMAGTTSLRNESVMLYISVEAYGEDRFNLVFNPCSANFVSLCPLNSSVPIFGQALIPVSTSDVAGIPSIALNIPDFEGSATLRLFSNSSQTQIACFSAIMRNGASLSHPTAIGTVLGLFTFVAILASFATVIYGEGVAEIRTHYAHSLSVLLLFEVFHSIFFSGALSMDWPSILTAWWSNFAWSAGMIYAPEVIKSLNSFVGITGNSSQVGGAGSTVLSNNGGLQQQIYGRSLQKSHTNVIDKSEGLLTRLFKRVTSTKTTEKHQVHEKLYEWAGVPVSPGLPLPGRWSDFSGELSNIGIPAADAFLNGFVWLLIIILILCAALISFKLFLEGLSAAKWIEKDRLSLFRTNWLEYLQLTLLRTCFIAFYMVMTLTLYQFSYGGRAGPIIIAALVFVIFFIGCLTTSYYACFYQSQFDGLEKKPEDLSFRLRKLVNRLSSFSTDHENSMQEREISKATANSSSSLKLNSIIGDSEHQTLHRNSDYIRRFGWLSARYRRTKWWFFVVWIVYQFVRACFVGGAREYPTAQVAGLFLWELISFILIAIINPFEGVRNAVLAIWLLGISKVLTAGLSIAFLPNLGLARIPTTIIGIFIIINQGLLVLGVLTLIVLGAISTHMSLSRNRHKYSPENLKDIRLKYFSHLKQKEKDIPPPPHPIPEPEEPKEPYFSVNTVRRAPKIEDEDPDQVSSLYNPCRSFSSLSHRPSSRVDSIAGSVRNYHSRHGNLPFGSRMHSASWSSRDFHEWQQNEVGRGNTPIEMSIRAAREFDTSNNSISSAPLIRPSTSVSSLRLATPSIEHQKQYANQRINGFR